MDTTPGDDNKAEAYRKLKGLLDHGIRHVVSLMEPDERNHSWRSLKPYKPLMQSIAETEGLEVTFSRMPIRDYDIPTQKEMIDILDLIDQKLIANQPVYVHCWGGRGRTGTVVGCYLARHGYASGKDVIGMIQRLRKNVPDSHVLSPENEKQVEMVVSWGSGG